MFLRFFHVPRFWFTQKKLAKSQIKELLSLHMGPNIILGKNAQRPEDVKKAVQFFLCRSFIHSSSQNPNPSFTRISVIGVKLHCQWNVVYLEQMKF